MFKFIIVLLSVFSGISWSQPWQGLVVAAAEKNSFTLLPGEKFVQGFSVSNDYGNVVGDPSKPGISSFHTSYESDKFNLVLDSVEEVIGSAPLEMSPLIKEEDGYKSITFLPVNSQVNYQSISFLRIFGNRKSSFTEGTLNLLFTLDVVLESQEQRHSNLPLVIDAIDGIRGDVDGNGFVDYEDVKAFIESSSPRPGGAINLSGTMRPWAYRGRYTPTDSVNRGKMILPGHSMPTLTSLTLGNIWVHNPDDPVVVNLGFDELMSETLPATKSGALAKTSSERFAWSLEGNVLEVETRPYAAVNAFAFSSDGTMWQKDGFADETGYWETKVDDVNLNYQVEVCDLIGGPVNSTPVITQREMTINMAFASSPVSYDLMGRKIQDGQKANLQVVVQNNLPMLSSR